MVWTIFDWAFLVGGGLCLLWAVGQWRVHSSKKTWPTAKGTILTSHLVSREGGYGDHWEPNVTYTYGVADGQQQYEGEAVVRKLEKKDAERWVHSHPAGTEISVIYDRRMPEISALPGSTYHRSEALEWLGLGTLCILVAALGHGWLDPIAEPIFDLIPNISEVWLVVASLAFYYIIKRAKKVWSKNQR